MQADVKDILGVGRGGDGTPSRPAPKKEKMKRPEGMSREAFALLGDSHPIAPVVELSKKAELKGLKEKRKITSPKGTVNRQDRVNQVTLGMGAGGLAGDAALQRLVTLMWSA